MNLRKQIHEFTYSRMCDYRSTRPEPLRRIPPSFLLAHVGTERRRWDTYIAAKARGWRLVKADDEFERRTGLSRAQILKTNKKDRQAYRIQEIQVIESTLACYKQDTVIIYSIRSIESHCQMLLRNYARTHPVIHIYQGDRICLRIAANPQGGQSCAILRTE